MIPLETNLEKIARLSVKNEKENFRFRTYLKMQDSEDVDRIVHLISKEVTEQIDCTACANCCIKLHTNLNDREINTLAKIENLSKEDFIAANLEMDDPLDGYFLKEMPCKYLKDKKCSIYEDRPGECRSYPNTDKDDFSSRTFGMINNYEICPIVFNVYERLKLEMGFKKWL